MWKGGRDVGGDRDVTGAKPQRENKRLNAAKGDVVRRRRGGNNNPFP